MKSDEVKDFIRKEQYQVACSAIETATKILHDSIKRKNELLKQAHTWLVACEWEIDIGVIADIEKELGINE